MIRASLAALALSCSFTAVAAAQEADPYLWLEDIEGQKALDWVKKENAATEKLLVTRPGFEADRKRAREILDDDRQIADPGEVMGDMIGSLAVIIAAIIIVTTGWMPADAIASLAIAVFIIPRAIGLLREVFSVLAQSVPRDTHVREIREHILRTDGVLDVHDIHVWQLTRGAPVFTAHVVVGAEMLTDGRSAALLEELQGCLAAHFDVEHSTFQLEPAGFTEPEHARHD